MIRDLKASKAATTKIKLREKIAISAIYALIRLFIKPERVHELNLFLDQKAKVRQDAPSDSNSSIPQPGKTPVECAHNALNVIHRLAVNKEAIDLTRTAMSNLSALMVQHAAIRRRIIENMATSNRKNPEEFFGYVISLEMVHKDMNSIQDCLRFLADVDCNFPAPPPEKSADIIRLTRQNIKENPSAVQTFNFIRKEDRG